MSVSFSCTPSSIHWIKCGRATRVGVVCGMWSLVAIREGGSETSPGCPRISATSVMALSFPVGLQKGASEPQVVSMAPMSNASLSLHSTTSLPPAILLAQAIAYGLLFLHSILALTRMASPVLQLALDRSEISEAQLRKNNSIWLNIPHIHVLNKTYISSRFHQLLGADRKSHQDSASALHTVPQTAPRHSHHTCPYLRIFDTR